MKIARFISKRISHQEKGSFSTTISKIVVGSVASGLFIVLISYAILLGFQRNIKQKIFSFGGHIILTKYDLNSSLFENPITVNKEFIAKCINMSNVASINTFSNKAGLIKTESEVQGAVLKGVDDNFNPKLFSKNLIKGRFIRFGDSTGSKEIVVSKKTAAKLLLDTGQTITIFFVQNPPRFRKLKVVGIFSTGLDEFDESVMLGDIKLIQKINNWDSTKAGGYEISLKNFEFLDQTADAIFANMDYDLGLEKITDKHITIFDWLVLLDQNVRIFLILILAVASFNMVSGLFIMIMERTQMIGLLKALGASNGQVRNIFFLNALRVIVYGLLLGNMAAAAFCFVQWHFGLLPLDPENYYMDTVPIEWDWQIWLLANAGLFIIMSLTVLIPNMVISNIQPVKAIRFD